MHVHRLAWLALALSLPAPSPAAEVTIYRCTDAQGRLTLRDTPCRRGETQQTRSMLRPTDPPPTRTIQVAPAPAPAPPPERTRIVVVTPPRPLYECVTPDGERYTSESDAGNPRWIPIWSLGAGYPAWPPRERRPPPMVEGHAVEGYGVEGHARGSVGSGGRYDVRIGGGGHHGHRPPPLAAPYLAGSWVRDVCNPLPAQEVCARLRDRRYELDRRYNSALQSERARITAEQRGIDARLANDCGDD